MTKVIIRARMFTPKILLKYAFKNVNNKLKYAITYLKKYHINIEHLCEIYIF